MKLQSAVLAQAFERGEWSRIAELRSMLRKISAGEPARCAEWIALACAALGRAGDAATLFTALAKAEPENSSHCVNLGSSLLAQSKPREALAVLEGALRRWPHQIDVRVNYGIACFAVERFEEAASELAPLAERQPPDDVVRLYAVRALQEIGRPDEARLLLEGWQPDWQSFALTELYQYAKLWIVAGRFALAEQALSQLLKGHPAEFTATLNLAGLYERNNRLDDAHALLAPLVPAMRASPLYLLTQAKLLARAARHAEALALFDAALAAPADKLEGLVPARFHSEVQFERGRILDGLGRYDDAFDAFTSANALIRDHHRRYNPAAGDGMRASWLTDARDLDRDVVRARTRGPAGESPIFLVGFPRSGTTLMDQMLDAHPALQVLEEKPALEAVVKSVANMPRGYPAALAGCDDGTLDNLRGIYWQAVNREITRKPGTRLVDKYPFNLVRIHLGMMLFPDARWIFAIRHPCDVVLSCFMQNFGFTDTTHGFWSIGQAASIYCQVMDLWLEQRARLRPDCFDLRYEDLVDDFEGRARDLVGFLGLEWSDAVLAYRRHAQSRRIATPSYSQVVQPIYRTAMGRWKRYEKYFGAVLPQLQPLIRRLGYGEDLNDSTPAHGRAGP